VSALDGRYRGREVGALVRAALRPLLFCEKPAKQMTGHPCSAVGLAAMTDAANLDSVAVCVDEEQAIISDAKPKLVSALESLHVAGARFGEAMQCGENLHRDGLTQAADVASRGIGPRNPFHFGCR